MFDKRIFLCTIIDSTNVKKRNIKLKALWDYIYENDMEIEMEKAKSWDDK